MKHSFNSLLRTKGRDAEQGGGQEQLQGPGTCPMGHVCVKMARADLGQVPNSRFSEKRGERELFIGTQFSILYTSMYSPAETATPRA
jgi:hypothetical protein